MQLLIVFTLFCILFSFLANDHKVVYSKALSYRFFLAPEENSVAQKLSNLSVKLEVLIKYLNLCISNTIDPQLKECVPSDLQLPLQQWGAGNVYPLL